MVATPGFRPPFMFYVGRYEWEISLLTLLYSVCSDYKFINNLFEQGVPKIFKKRVLGRNCRSKLWK